MLIHFRPRLPRHTTPPTPSSISSPNRTPTHPPDPNAHLPRPTPLPSVHRPTTTPPNSTQPCSTPPNLALSDLPLYSCSHSFSLQVGAARLWYLRGETTEEGNATRALPGSYPLLIIWECACNSSRVSIAVTCGWDSGHGVPSVQCWTISKTGRFPSPTPNCRVRCKLLATLSLAATTPASFRLWVATSDNQEISSPTRWCGENDNNRLCWCGNSHGHAGKQFRSEQCFPLVQCGSRGMHLVVKGWVRASSRGDVLVHQQPSFSLCSSTNNTVLPGSLYLPGREAEKARHTGHGRPEVHV